MLNDAPNTITTVFDPNSGDGLQENTLSFITDGAGVLTAVPSAWADFNPGGGTNPPITSTNDPQGNVRIEWFSNGLNWMYQNLSVGGDTRTANIANAANTILPASWTNPAAALPPASPSAIPTLSQWAMILLSLMLLAIGLVKTRRSY